MRVRASIDFWREIGASPLVLRWIREGVRIDWLHRPPPPFHQGISRTKPEHLEWLTAECDRCLLTGAFVRATCFDFVSKAFIVEHNGKKRLVFNLKHLNDYCVKRQCRFGSLSALRRTLHDGDLMWSIDLTDAYHHVGIYEPHQKYFTFAIDGALLARYFAARARVSPQLPEFAFQLPGEQRPTTACMERWLDHALTRCRIRPPPGFAYLGHSLRSLGASAMAAIGVPRHIYIWLGGWARGSSVVDRCYIDPTFAPSAAAYALYGWALQRRFAADSGTVVRTTTLPDPRTTAPAPGPTLPESPAHVRAARCILRRALGVL